MILEQVFAIPGLGKLMVDAINNRDHPQVRGSVVLLATSTSIINLLIDIMYAYIDPRIKSQFASGSKKKLKEIKSNESKEAAA
jgi:peptide/nickel transport system permease protein